MNLTRVIEEFNNTDDTLNDEYILDITPEIILKILDDIILNENDYPNEIYDCYDINKHQLAKLKPYLKNSISEDFTKYSYVLSCYEGS